MDANDKLGNYISGWQEKKLSNSINNYSKIYAVIFFTEPWFDMYLSSRDSIVLNYNPFIAFKNDPNPGQMNQVYFLIFGLEIKNFENKYNDRFRQSERLIC